MKRLKADQFNLPYQVMGNMNGPTILYLHGGPGFCVIEDDLDKFDLTKVNVVLFQQRGAILSGGIGDTKNNTTPHLVQDLENLRKTLNVSSWAIYGQSWGTFLGLCYAIKFPKRVTHLLMKGVFLGRKEDITWLYSESGLGSYSPKVREEFDKLRDSLSLGRKENILEDFGREALKDPPNVKACVDWTIWEDINCVASHEEMKYPEVDETYEQISVAMARMETHYFLNNCFMEENYVLKNVHKINCPISIFHGETDRICPENQARSLEKEALKNGTNVSFNLIPLCGHSTNEQMIGEIRRVSSELSQRSSLMDQIKRKIVKYKK